MLPHILLALGGLLLLWLIWDRFGRRRAIPFSRILGSVLLAGLVALGIVLLLGGKFAGVLAVMAGLWPWMARALRLYQLWHWLKRLGGSAPSRPHSSTDSAEAPRSPATKGMSDEEAWHILDLPPGASEEDIRAAHRRLMQANHPDHGGSTWIASRINQARDHLLRQK